MNITMKSFALILLLCFINRLNAQPQYGQSYGTSSTYEYFYSGQQTADGGFILGGGQSNGIFNAWLVRTDNNGDTIWTKRVPFAGTDFDIVRETTDNGFIGAGAAICAKFNSTGTLLWKYGSTDTSFFDVRETSDGGYLLAGYTFPNQEDAFLAKLTANGDTSWTRAIGGANSQRFTTVHELANGNFIVMGSINSRGYISEWNSLGNLLWSKSIGSHIIRGIKSQDGGFLVFSSNEIIKTNAVGDSLWSKNFSGYIFREGISTMDGGYAFSGWSGTDGLLLRLDSLGNSIWTQSFLDQTGSIYLYSVVEESNGNFVGAGATTSNGTDGYLSKVDPSGNHFILEVPKIDAAAKNISIFPNPTSSALFVQIEEMDSYILKAEILNVLGQRLYKYNLNNQTTKLDLNKLPVGAYFLKISDQQNRRLNTFKIIKKTD